jgi:nickel-dependent lactate racemase
MVLGKGGEDKDLDEKEIAEIIAEGIPDRLVEGKKILVLTPDATRTMPLPMMTRIVHDVLGPQAQKLDFMIALGTHRPLTQGEIHRLYGIERGGDYGGSRFFNHRWDREDTFIKIGRLEATEINNMSNGLFNEGIDIVINRAVYEYDLLLILGPVFPHEVVGFSGGNKYLFPGISGGEFLHFFHWLGAVITNWSIIGKKDTPTRRAVDRAAEFIGVKRHCVSLVVRHDRKIAGVFVGSPEETWSQAAELSSKIHIRYVKKPFKVVLGEAAGLYDELWTAGKVMYKLEPVVADGGKLVIYGKHVNTISHTWGDHLERIGYHVRDYFLSRMDRFKDIPRGVLAHSSHVKGLGFYEKGRERPRIDVCLATSLSEKTCRKINLGFVDADTLKINDYRNREDEGILFVENAGEILHRLEGE